MVEYLCSYTFHSEEKVNDNIERKRHECSKTKRIEKASERKINE